MTQLVERLLQTSYVWCGLKLAIGKLFDIVHCFL